MTELQAALTKAHNGFNVNIASMTAQFRTLEAVIKGSNNIDETAEGSAPDFEKWVLTV